MRINEHFYKKNFPTDTQGITFYDIKTTDKLHVYGLYNFQNEPVFKRMPSDIAEKVSERVFLLHTNPSGGRIRFKTNSNRLMIRVVLPNLSTRSILTMVNQAGFDVYQTINGEQQYIGCMFPPIDVTDGYMQTLALDEGEKELTINMPLYNDIAEVYIGLESDATLSPAKDYKHEKPILFYGSSITQGASVSRPGMQMSSIISRRLDTNFINLGFASGAKAEPEMIDYLASLDCSVFVSDYDHNAPDAEHLAATHEKLYKAVRKNHPDIPYIMLTKPILYISLDNEENDRRREIIRTTYKNAIENGDKNVYFIDGKEIFKDVPGGNCGADSVHPNDLGMSILAESIIKVITENKLLG